MEINAASSETATGAGETNNAARDLAEVAQNLEDAVTKFEI